MGTAFSSFDFFSSAQSTTSGFLTLGIDGDGNLGARSDLGTVLCGQEVGGVGAGECGQAVGVPGGCRSVTAGSVHLRITYISP